MSEPSEGSWSLLVVAAVGCFLMVAAAFMYFAPKGDPPPKGYHWEGCLVEDKR